MLRSASNDSAACLCEATGTTYLRPRMATKKGTQAMFDKKLLGIAVLLLVTLVYSQPSYAIPNPFQDLVNEWKKAVNSAKSKLSSAEKEVINAMEALAQTTNVRNSIKASLAQAKKDLAAAEKRLSILSAERRRISASVTSFTSKVQDLDGEVKELGESLRKLRGDLLAQELIAYKLNTPVKLDFNLSTNSYFVDIQIAQGLNYDTKKVDAILAGQVELPTINPLDAAASASGFHTSISSDYKSYRNGLFQKHGAGNVYVASERFVDWAGPERLAESGIKSLVGSSKDVAQDAKAMLELEYQDLVAWFRVQGQLNAELLAAEMLECLLQGKTPSFGTSDVKAEVSKVNYTYSAEHRGFSKIPQVMILKKAGVKIPEAKATQSMPHICFAIIVKRAPSESPAIDNAKKWLKSFQTVDMDDVLTAVAKHGGDQLGKVLKLAGGGAAAENEIKRSISERVRKELGMSSSEMNSFFATPDPVIDLKSTTVGDRLKRLFDEIALGNRGSASIESFELELPTMRLIARIQLTHEHSWGTVAEASREVSKALGGASVSVTDFLDDNVRNSIKSFEDKIGSVTASLNKAKKSLKDAQGNLVSIDKKITAAKTKVSSLNGAVGRISKQLAIAEARVRNASIRVESAAKLERDARNAWSRAEGELRTALKKFNDWRPHLPPIPIPNPF